MAAYNYYGQPYGNMYGGGYYSQNNYQGQQMIQPQMPQPMQQPQQMQSYSPAINQNGIIWISGLQEAQMYPIAPNNAVALWEKSGKVIYLKQADATGRPSLTIYDLVERKETAPDASSGKDVNSVSYATKDELSTIVDAVKGLAGEVETMKGDLYGAVGKRKSVKKAEVEEDD